MGGVVSGILIISAVIAVGYLAVRCKLLAPEVQGALTRTAFYITNPALLFTVVAGSDIRAALGVDAPLALLSAAAMGLLYCLLSFLFFRRPVAETAVGAMASSYANANNIGIPVSLYAVGTASTWPRSCWCNSWSWHPSTSPSLVWPEGRRFLGNG